MRKLYLSNEEYSFNPSFLLGVVYQPQVIDPLLFEVVEHSDGSKSVSMVNDISLLLDNSRLNNIGQDTINNWIKTLQPKSDALASLRSKCSDGEILSLIKSRHVQCPADFLAWTDYLDANFDRVKSRYHRSSDKSSDKTVSDKVSDKVLDEKISQS